MNASVRSRRTRQLLAIVLIVVSLGLAFSWLLPATSFGQVPLSNVVRSILAREKDIRKLVTRSGEGDGSQGLVISAQYGNPEFFAYQRREQGILEYQPRAVLVFLLTESVGVGQLADQPPTPTLRVDGATKFVPLASSEELQRWRVVSQSLNQRSSVVRFPRSALTPSTKSLDLVFGHEEGIPAQTLHWDLPMAYPENILVGEGWSFDVLLGIASGLIYAHFTCLLQLAAVFFATVFGLGLVAQTQVFRFSVRYVVGMVLVYTAVGAFAGWTGDAITSSGLAYLWIAPLYLVSGALVVLLALWMGNLAHMPLLARVRLPVFFSLDEGTGQWLPLLMGAAWALGCITCFDGLVYPTLLIYTGISGSAFVGGAILFLFSTGIGIAFLVSSMAMRLGFALMPTSSDAKVDSTQPTFATAVQSILVGLLAMVIIGLGVSMLTGNFHNVSNIAFQWIRVLGLF